LIAEQTRVAPQPAAQKLSITGSFDPNDFDSFDEDEEGTTSNRVMNNDAVGRKLAKSNAEFHIPLESIEKIRQSALQQQFEFDEPRGVSENQTHQEPMQMVQFDPNDFDSFDEDDDQRQPSLRPQRISPPVQLPSINIDLSK